MPVAPTADHPRRQFLRLVASGLATLALAPPAGEAAARAPAGAPVKIGMVGSGRQGGALGALLVEAGHPVMFSSRHPERLQDFAARLGPLARTGTVEQAVAFGDVVVVAIPYGAMEELGKAHGRALASKALVIDVSNPIARRDGEDVVKRAAGLGGPGLATARFLSGARVVRAFNAIGAGRLSQIASRSGHRVGVPIAGDDPEAIALAERLIREIGFEPVLVGGLAMGKHLVPGTPLAGEHSPDEIRRIAAGLR